MTNEEVKAMFDEVFPHMEAIREIVKKHSKGNKEVFLDTIFDGSGYANVTQWINGQAGWCGVTVFHDKPLKDKEMKFSLG